MKRLAVPKVGAVFEELGFTYMGPVDGHDIGAMVRTFQEAHRSEGPVLVRGHNQRQGLPLCRSRSSGLPRAVGF